MLNPDFWRGKRVFVTGQTGFKGSWLCLWLHSLGAKVTGFSQPPPSDPSLFEIAKVAGVMDSQIGDVRDLSALEKSLAAAEPEIVIHMAAQTLVRYSYRNPIETFGSNVMGSVNLLEAVRRVPGVRAVVMVTSDKCYHNEEWVWGYNENSKMGGEDPYSASKGCSELVVNAYMKSFFSDDSLETAVASARAGNVIGGGDWAEDRLIPDIIRSLLKNEPTVIRKPHATRPWQHVLEPLHGYMMLAERLYNDGREFASGWNFGPPDESERTVGWMIAKLYDIWDVDFEWVRDTQPGPPEATFLKLDASKAKAYLDWHPKLDLMTTLRWIADWTRQYAAGSDMRQVTIDSIGDYMAIPAPE